MAIPTPIPLTARKPVSFWPMSLAGTKENPNPLAKVEIRLRVPTYFERDNFAVALLRAGFVNYSTAQIRDNMRAGIVPVFGEAAFDQMTAEFEEIWQAGDAMSVAQRQKLALAINIREREDAKAPSDRLPQEEIDAEIAAVQPTVVLEETRRVRIWADQQKIMADYQPLVAIIGDLHSQENTRNWYSVQTFVLGWSGLQHAPDEKREGPLERFEAEYLRDAIGSEAFTEVAEFIVAMHGITEDEEKNLALLLGSLSRRHGSTASTSKASSTIGSSTDEPIGEIQGSTTSTTISDTSSSSMPSARKTRRGRPPRTRTAEA